MAIFEKVAKHDKKIKDAKTQAARSEEALGAHAEADANARSSSSTIELATELRQVDFTPQTRNRMINKLKDIDNELAQTASMVRKDDAALKREKDKTRRDFYRRRLQKYVRTSCRSWRRSTARTHDELRRRSARSAPAKRKPIRPSRS